MMILAFIMIFLGFVQFAMAIDSHYQAVYGRRQKPGRRRYLFQAVACLHLLAALWVCTTTWQLSIAIIVWIGLIQLAAVLVAALLTWRSSWYGALWRFGCLGRLCADQKHDINHTPSV